MGKRVAGREERAVPLVKLPPWLWQELRTDDAEKAARAVPRTREDRARSRQAGRLQQQTDRRTHACTQAWATRGTDRGNATTRSRAPYAHRCRTTPLTGSVRRSAHGSVHHTRAMCARPSSSYCAGPARHVVAKAQYMYRAASSLPPQEERSCVPCARTRSTHVLCAVRTCVSSYTCTGKKRNRVYNENTETSTGAFTRRRRLTSWRAIFLLYCSTHHPLWSRTRACGTACRDD
jgi:hypothetical protein